MHGAVGHNGARGKKKKKKKNLREGQGGHICVLCSAIASPSLLSSSPIRVNPKEPAILLLVAVRLGMTEGKGILHILIKSIIKTVAEHH